MKYQHNTLTHLTARSKFFETIEKASLSPAQDTVERNEMMRSALEARLALPESLVEIEAITVIAD